MSWLVLLAVMLTGWQVYVPLFCVHSIAKTCIKMWAIASTKEIVSIGLILITAMKTAVVDLIFRMY